MVATVTFTAVISMLGGARTCWLGCISVATVILGDGCVCSSSGFEAGVGLWRILVLKGGCSVGCIGKTVVISNGRTGRWCWLLVLVQSFSVHVVS